MTACSATSTTTSSTSSSAHVRARPPVQDEIRARMLNALDEGAGEPGPHIVVSHGMGTVIAYDCLKRVARAPVVDGLMTIGSPLGLDEIQDKLARVDALNGFPSEKVAAIR